MNSPEKTPRKSKESLSQIELMAALNFTDADLKTNRAGFLSVEQRGRIEGEPPSPRRMIIGTLITLVITQFLLIIADNETDPSLADLLFGAVFVTRLIALLFCIAVALLYRTYRYPTRAPFRKNREVRQITEVVRLKHHSEVWQGHPIESFEVHISGNLFNVDRQVYDAFLPDRRYTVYYHAKSHTLLSAEPVKEA